MSKPVPYRPQLVKSWGKCPKNQGWEVVVEVVKVTQSYLTLATPWTVARQALLSMGFSRQEYWSGLPFPSPGDLPDAGVKPKSSALQADSLLTELRGKPSEDKLLQYILALLERVGVFKMCLEAGKATAGRFILLFPWPLLRSLSCANY